MDIRTPPLRGSGPRGRPNSGPGVTVPLLVWAMAGLMTLGVFATYARIPIAELYNVSRDGLSGGASRMLTFLNFPVAFIAIVMIGFAFARFYSSWTVLSTTTKVVVAIIGATALGLSLIAAIPGVVVQGDLDARVVNVFPAVGALMAVVLTIASLRVRGAGSSRPWTAFDNDRLIITAVAVVLALPWIFAEFGVHIGDIPVLGSPFMSREIPVGESISAVHLGDHHGVTGVMFLLAGLWLSRELHAVRTGFLRWPLAAYLSLMMVYGTFIAVQDFRLEQIVKRGWTTVEIPSMVKPALSPAWGLILVGTTIIAIMLIRVTSVRSSATAPSTPAVLDLGSSAGVGRRKAPAP